MYGMLNGNIDGLICMKILMKGMVNGNMNITGIKGLFIIMGLGDDGSILMGILLIL